MSRIFYNSQSQPIQLSHKVGTGGEGAVYEIFGQSEFVAKIYHEAPAAEKAEKLIALSQLSNDRLQNIAAWPVDVLSSEAGGQLAGFVMKRIGQASEVHTLHSPKSRLQKFPEASWAFLIYVAANIARAIAAMHKHGFIVGDLNPKNILVTHQATVTLLDCDSFQVAANGKTFRCEGGFPEYLPPELQGKSLRDIERSQQHDCFGLAVVIFQLLFMGRHPFSGRFLGEGEQTLEEAIRKSRFAFGADAAARQMQQPPGTLSLDAIPPSLANLFRRAFLSYDRPQPQEWIEPLESLVKSLKPCELHSGHFYFSELTECPWCEIEMRARIRLFNFSLNGNNGRNHFRLDQVWQKIEKFQSLPVLAGQANAVVSLEQMRNRLAFSATNILSPEVQAYARNRNVKMWQAALFAATASFATGFFADWSVAFTFLFLAGWAAKAIARAEFKNKGPQITNLNQNTLPPANNPLAEKVRTRLSDAMERAQRLELQLKKAPGQAQLQSKLTELKNRKEVYERLTKIREFKLRHLERTESDRQLRDFLDQFPLNQAQVKDVDELTVASLRSRGIETAADVTPESLKQIADLTEAQAQQLLFWRATARRGFKFDWAQDVQVQQRLTIEREMDNLRMQVEHDLSVGAMYLQRLHQDVASQQKQLADSLPEAYRSQAQSEKDWEAAQKTNSMWPLMLVLLLFLMLGAFTSLYRKEPNSLGTKPAPAENKPSDNSSSETQSPLPEEMSDARKHFEEGQKLAGKGKWKVATASFRRAIEFNSKYQQAYTQLGYVLYKQKKYDESIQASMVAIKLHDEFEPNFYLGLANRAKKDWIAAAQAFGRGVTLASGNKGLEKSSEFADANYYLGEALANTGQLKATIKGLEPRVMGNWGTVAERFQLATLYLWDGQDSKVEHYRYIVLSDKDENLVGQLQRLMLQHYNRK